MNKNQQLDDLMDELRETLEALPDDGNERRVEIQVGPNNSGNVSAGPQVIVKLGPEAPTRSEASRMCPQCHQATWRHTRECMHCHLDLFAHDHAVWKAAVMRRAQRSMFLFGGTGLALILGAGLILPANIAGWAGLVGFAFLFMGVVAGKQGEDVEKQ